MAAAYDEVICFASASITAVREVHAEHSREAVVRFNCANAGAGYVVHDDASGAGITLTWTLDSSQPDHLHLTEVDLSGQRSAYAGRFEFEASLFPHVATQQQRLVALTEDGFLHSLDLPGPLGHQSLFQGLSVTSLDLHAELRELGTPTLLAVTHDSAKANEVILIGGQSGSLLVVPIACFSAKSASGSYELHDTASRYLSFFGKTTVPAIVWASALRPVSSELVCILHEDFSMRFWNIRTKHRVSAGTLLQQSGLRANLVPSKVGAVCSTQGHLRLVVHLQPKEGSSEQPQTVAVSMDLQQASDGSLQVLNMKERMLKQSDTTFSCILSQQDTADPHSAHTWLLSPDPSLHAISSSVSASSEVAYHTTLVEEQGSTIHTEQHNLQDEVWSTLQATAQHAGQALPNDLMAKHHMQHMLAPGMLSQGALADTLTELRQPLASEHASLQEAQQHLTAAAQALQAQHKLSEVASWRQVIQTYWKHWAQHHPAVGLLPMPGGSVAIVRGGHTLTLLRKTDPTSDLQQQATSSSTDQQPPLTDVQKLQQGVGLMEELLGPDVLSLFATLSTMASPLLSMQAICSAFVEVLISGPGLHDNEALPNHAARQALLAWRRKRSATILSLGQVISSMESGTPVAALRAYIDLLQPQHASQQATAGVTNNSTPILGEALTVVLRQAATQQLQASSYLLLIAWLTSLRAAGVLTISPIVSHVLQQEIVPQLQAHVCRTATSQWLCTAPAAVPVDEEANRSQSAQLHQQLASLAFASGSASQDSTRHHCIAQLLLRDFASLDGVSVVQQPAEAAAALAAYLHAGCQHPSTLTPLLDTALVQQVLALGLHFIQHNQWPHMQHLLSLAGIAAETAGCQFLKGFASLQQASRSTSDKQDPATEEAVSNLFQAANVFKAANQAAHYGQQAHVAASCDMIKRVINNLLVNLTGSYSKPAAGAEELQYFEALMLQCEQWGQPQAAAQFAQAALHEVEKVYADQNAPLEEDRRALWVVQRHRREDRLCANLFVYALDAGHYADAYNAVQASPTAHGALSNLQRLVNTLINTSNIATLCQLPYAAYYKLARSDGRHEMISLAEATHQLLEQRAANSEVGSNPQPYDILYDFHLMRSNFKAAAAAQYELAMRIRQEGRYLPDALARIAHALAAAVNGLSMLEPSQQWLFNPRPLHQALQNPQTFAPSGQEPHPGPSNSTPPKRAHDSLLTRCKKGVAASVVVLSGHSVPEGYSHYSDLTKEHAAAQAHVTLASVEPEAAHRPTVPDDIFHRLLAAGLFQAALSLAVVLYKGLALTQALEAALAAMATVCVQKQLETAQDHAPSADAHLVFGQAPDLQGSDNGQDAHADFDSLSPDAAWAVLLQALQQYDTRQHGCRLHLAAVQAALGKERRLKLPAPLLAPFQAEAAQQEPKGMAGRAADPASLLTVYLRYDRLADAADLVLTHFAAYQKADITSRQGHCQVWFPYRLISEIIGQMKKAPALYNKRQQLQRALETHQTGAMELSAALQVKYSDAVIMEE